MENSQQFGQSKIFPGALLNVHQVAIRLNISRSHTYALMQTGTLKTVHLGRSVRVRPEDLEEFINSNRSGENI
ncbi:MAG: hypothetical protein C3F13_09570 [Anaerolineales bacterium]|nr:helix-turn-helix domain-containing protein [Anaerolineae bacterium]PWB53381.1 MAG: hypothetical protein C3F13_09570 [Anaerolineales bacterium]